MTDQPTDPRWLSRSHYLKILKDQVSATGLDGADLQEVFDRLDATETNVLRDCVELGAEKQAAARAKEGE